MHGKAFNTCFVFAQNERCTILSDRFELPAIRKIIDIILSRSGTVYESSVKKDKNRLRMDGSLQLLSNVSRFIRWRVTHINIEDTFKASCIQDRVIDSCTVYVMNRFLLYVFYTTMYIAKV